MSGQPWYFGPALRSRFAMVHWPEGPVRAAVVICPPLGYDAVCAHAALRELAERLAGLGVVAVRVEYDGTGNSAGLDTDPDRVEQWRRTILDCVDGLAELGLEDVTLVGLRVGALLAASAAADTARVRELVLWDPPTTGKRYVRALRLMAATGAVPTGDRPGVVVAGLTFPDEALADLAKLGNPIATAVDSVDRVLHVQPAELGAPPEAADHHVVDTVVLAGTSALLDTSVEEAVMPVEILDRIASWVDSRSPTELVPQPRPGPFPSSARGEGRGTAVRHQARYVGPNDLFLVVTEPDEPNGRAVVMMNNGGASQIGPGRAWVEWAEQLAQQGITTIRADIGGLGDSPAQDGQPSQEVHPLTAGTDIADVAAFAREHGASEVVALGLCSGALLAFDGLVAGAPLDAVVAINGRFDRPWSDTRRRGGRRAGGATPTWIAIPLSKSPLFPTFDRVPTWVWRLLAGLRLVASPAVALRQLRGKDVRLLLVFGPEEWGLKALRRRAPREFAEHRASSRVTFTVVPDLDHSMFDPDARDTVFGIFSDYLTGTLGWPAPALDRQERGGAAELRGSAAGNE